MYGNELTLNTASHSAMSTWGIISAVLAIVGGILVVTLFLKKENKNKFKGFVKWLYDFLNFDFFSIDVILRVLYSAITIYIILASFELISTSFVLFLSFLASGLLVTRLAFETFLMLIKIWKNTSEINEKMKK